MHDNESHLGRESLVQMKTMVMVQEDQAGELWSSGTSLYTLEESFKAPHETP